MKPPPWDDPGEHRPETCPTCGPYVNSGAWRRGIAKAKAQTEKLIKGMDKDDEGT